MKLENSLGIMDSREWKLDKMAAGKTKELENAPGVGENEDAVQHGGELRSISAAG